jgi:hypothetical protein
MSLELANANGSEAGAYEMTEQKSNYLAERQKVLRNQRKICLKDGIFVWSSEGTGESTGRKSLKKADNP